MAMTEIGRPSAASAWPTRKRAAGCGSPWTCRCRGPFDYRHAAPLVPGMRVIVPFGRRRLVGIVTDTPAAPSIDPIHIKPIDRVLDDLPPFTPDWLRLARFAAAY